jgi:hypothetical protein
MEQWMSPWDVPAFAELDLGDDPEALDEMPWHYSRKGVNETFLTLEQVAERVNAHPDEKHKIWQVGSERWIEPHELERLRPMLNIREEESPPRLLLYSRNRKNSRYLSAEEIVASMAEHPDGVHKVWPHLEERWLNPWEVEELQALGVEAPEEVDDLDWYYKVGNTQHRNWSSEQVAVSVIKNPDEEHLVWQLGWDRWEDPRGVPVISSMLPPEMR